MIFTAFIIPGTSVDNSDFDHKAPYYMEGNIIEAYAYF